MADAPPVDEIESRDHESRLTRLSTTKGLLLQAGLLLLILAILLPTILDGHGIAYSDEGVYAAQVESLSRGSWFETQPAPDVPAVENLNGIGPEVVRGQRYAGYVRHSLFIRWLVPFYRLGGFSGLLLSSVLAGAVAAFTAALIARRLDPRIGAPALWMTAIGTPLVFDSYLVAAHVLAAATCGLAAVGLTQALIDRRRASLIWCMPCVAATVMLRSEGAIVMAALGGAIGLVGLITNRRRLRDGVPTYLIGGLVVVVAAAAYFLDAELARRITGLGEPTQTFSRFEKADREYLPQIWASLLRPWYTNVFPQPLIALGSLSVVLSALLHRLLGPRRAFISLSILSFGAALLLVEARESGWFVTGLFAACPLLPAGWILLRRSDMSRPTASVGAVTIVVSAVGIILTAYTEGGATEWGGRFYAVLLPLMVPLALLGLGHAVEELPRHARRVAVAAALVTSLSLSALALQSNAQARENNTYFVKSTLSAVRRLTANPDPLLILGGTNIGGTSRSFWDKRKVVDLIVGPSVVAMFALIGRAALNGYDEVALMTDFSPSHVDEVGRAWLDPIKWHQVRSTPIGSTGWTLYLYAAKPR